MSNEDGCTYIKVKLNSFGTFKFPMRTSYYLYNTNTEPNTWSILSLEEILEIQIKFNSDKIRYHSIRVQCVDQYFNELGCYKFGY